MVSGADRHRLYALAAACGVGLLGACAGADVAVVAPPGAAETPLLTAWLSIDGGWRADPGGLPRAAASTAGRLRFVKPVGVAARGDVVLVADAGARMLWRLDRARDTIAPFAPFAGGVAEQGAALLLGDDFSVWAALPAERAVAQYDLRGRRVRTWRDDDDAGRPVALALPETRGELWVGDAATLRIVVFDPLGRSLYQLGGPKPVAALQSIAAMSFGPLGLYVLDRVAQQVVVLGSRGEVVGLVGENQLVQPRAMAVDRSGRVFVGDDADQRIKVFRGARLLASFGGAGGGAGRFGRIEAMAIDGNLLYVADSVNARVQVLLVAPVSMERPLP